jgi:hypothetical protein
VRYRHVQVDHERKVLVLVSPRRRRSGALRQADAEDDPGIGPSQFRLEASTDSCLTDDGEHLDGRGYTICDPHTGTRLREDDFFFRIGGGIVTDLIVTAEHEPGLQDAAFSPGRVLALIHHPPRSTDGPPVIAVHDPSGALQAGELPASVAGAIASYGDGYEAAFCLWEWRTEAGHRVGLRLLLAPGWQVQPLPDPPLT